jgi:hypothetical protein
LWSTLIETVGWDNHSSLVTLGAFMAMGAHLHCAEPRSVPGVVASRCAGDPDTQPPSRSIGVKRLIGQYVFARIHAEQRIGPAHGFGVAIEVENVRAPCLFQWIHVSRTFVPSQMS